MMLAAGACCARVTPTTDCRTATAPLQRYYAMPMNNAILELTSVIRDVALVESPAEQVRQLVDSVSRAIGVDVCSLYREDDSGTMVLLASHGLVATQPVEIPAGKGLVGLVARSRHVINIEDAPRHPDYLYLPQTREERFRSFCGAPLVRFGRVVGVLVVQRAEPCRLSDEHEAFLTTLAAHLALLVDGMIPPARPASLINVRVEGVTGAPGIGIGTAKLCNSGTLDDVGDSPCEDADEEIAQWRQLVDDTRRTIRAEQASLGSRLAQSVAGIFDAHHMLLSDPALSERVEAEIRAGHALPSAVKTSIRHFADVFLELDDPYLKARHEDIRHLGDKLYQVWRGGHTLEGALDALAGPVVLAGPQISASDIAAVPPGSLAGIVCFEGSALSHTAVLANALGIPAVMGAGELRGLSPGERMVVDGNVGQIIRNPGDAVVREFQQLMRRAQSFVAQLEELRDLPATTRDGVRIHLLTNTGLLADIMPGIRNGAEGVGLYRTEIPFMVRQSFPTEDEQVAVYRKVFEAYRGKPVYVRTLDIGADKQLPYFPLGHEDNPALGWRGIRFTLDNIQLLMTQVRAIIRAAQGDEQVRILLPMISSTSELIAFRQLLDDACQQLREEGCALCRPRVGAMLEVPAAISQLWLWRDRIDFISIGSNDLSQYLLALDRNNARVAKRYDHVHPGVLNEIQRIVGIAGQCRLPLSLCGEMASDPVAVLLLIGMGIRTLSTSSAQLPRMKWLIRSVSLTQAEALLERALQQDSVEAIRRLGREALEAAGLHELLG